MKEKKWIFWGLILVFFLVLFFGIFIEFGPKKGDVSHVEIKVGESSYFTSEEIHSAIQVVLERFSLFPATLEKIWYSEKDSLKESEERKRTYQVEDVMILYSNFKTYKGEIAIQSGFNSSSEYQNWKWILVRNSGESWQLKDWGY